MIFLMWKRVIFKIMLPASGLTYVHFAMLVQAERRTKQTCLFFLSPQTLFAMKAQSD